MPSRNDITGDTLISKSATEAYRDGWDRIFGNKARKPEDLEKKEEVKKEKKDSKE